LIVVRKILLQGQFLVFFNCLLSRASGSCLQLSVKQIEQEAQLSLQNCTVLHILEMFLGIKCHQRLFYRDEQFL